ncbi:DUF2218 domain-containing protein [Mycobacteroides saopaulense]|uniref:DUF2218 domain-containing protein n=1 Tax=Mycobacteroides saopaulense TaxID=1578165 RepID=A0ABX3C2Y4_9MYCO|nr:DUF2218 domain-containing protein [Mycobacteroides saopaulense]ALR13355.1 hypothetical protein MYCSP_20270 [Mycobacteroides saopaulense]OHT85288.1 hypothetical protein BKG68_15960 [Mycobacteroides saopaulense]OHU11439.1 hypothetical protein BKG73_09000 [Mycobacteroides saopaulense]
MTSVHGTIPTDRPERYAKQLAQHWAAKSTVSELEGGAVRIEISPDAVTVLRPQPGVLHVEASTAEFGDVVKRHLERFGTRDELTLTWAAD